MNVAQVQSTAQQITPINYVNVHFSMDMKTAKSLRMTTCILACKIFVRTQKSKITFPLEKRDIAQSRI